MGARRPKDIGTADETAVVRALTSLGFPHAERRALRGTSDAGDITGLPGVMVEVKGGQKGRTASDQLVHEWMVDQVLPQTRHAGADLGMLVTPRTGIGKGNAERWWAHLFIADLAVLAHQGHQPAPALPNPWAHSRLPLWEAVLLLRHAGYGHPLEEGNTP